MSKEKVTEKPSMDRGVPPAFRITFAEIFEKARAKRSEQKSKGS